MTADPLSRVFSALADPTRRDMVARLAVADATVNELAAPYDVSLQAVSKHLRVLEDAGLVSRTRDAQRRPVHLEAEVFDLMTKWIERYRREAEERYRRLDDVLRSMPDDASTAPHHPRQEKHDDQHPHPRDRDHRRRRRPARPDHPRVRRPAGEGLPGPHRPRARRAVARPARPDDDGRPLRLPQRRVLPLRALARRRGVRLQRLLPRGAPRRAHRADLHLRGVSPTASRSRSSCSRTSGTAAPGSSRRRSSTRSRAATPSSRAAWRAASSEGYEKLDELLAG